MKPKVTQFFSKNGPKMCGAHQNFTVWFVNTQCYHFGAKFGTRPFSPQYMFLQTQNIFIRLFNPKFRLSIKKGSSKPNFLFFTFSPTNHSKMPQFKLYNYLVTDFWPPAFSVPNLVQHQKRWLLVRILNFPFIRSLQSTSFANIHNFKGIGSGGSRIMVAFTFWNRQIASTKKGE